LEKKPAALGAPGSGNYTGVANIRTKRDEEGRSSTAGIRKPGEKPSIYKPNLTNKTREASYFVSGGTGQQLIVGPSPV
jgi:hypothetical protein